MEVKKVFLVLALASLLIYPAHSQKVEMDTSEAVNSSPSAADKIGFFVDARSGVNYRTNTFVTTQPLLEDKDPISYSSLDLGVYSFSLDAGILGSSVIDAEYKSPYPQTSFSEEALSARKNAKIGLKKYTFGVDLTPVWRFVLPNDTPKFWVYLPSFQIKIRKEITQNAANTNREVLFIDQNLNKNPDRTYKSINFSEIGRSQELNFKTDYIFYSITWPLDSEYYERKRKHKEFRFGLSVWEYSRIYVTKFPQLNTDMPVIYEPSNTSVALNGVYKRTQRTGFQIEVDGSLGISSFTLKGQEKSLKKLFKPAGKDSDINNAGDVAFEAEIKSSYKFSFFNESNLLDLQIEPGVILNVFGNRFDVFDKDTLNDDDKSDIFVQADILFTPWIKANFSIN